MYIYIYIYIYTYIYIYKEVPPETVGIVPPPHYFDIIINLFWFKNL